MYSTLIASPGKWDPKRREINDPPLKKELPLAHANYQTYLGYLPESVLLTSIHLVCANVGRSSGLGFKWIAQKILLAPELNPHNPPSLYHRTGPP